MGARPRSDAARGPSAWEWVAAAGGGLILLATIAFLAYRNFTASTDPPTILLSVASIQRASPQYVVVIAAVNQGGRTAAEVKVAATLSTDGRVIERRELTFDYLPVGSVRRGGVFFEHDPSAPNARLLLQASGYQEP